MLLNLLHDLCAPGCLDSYVESQFSQVLGHFTVLFSQGIPLIGKALVVWERACTREDSVQGTVHLLCRLFVFKPVLDFRDARTHVGNSQAT